jgi:hypothetical protein
VMSRPWCSMRSRWCSRRSRIDVENAMGFEGTAAFWVPVSLDLRKATP